ncbi:ABC transporter permease [Brooklawnia cerclae]|uniref:Peptide/nickel transport system permease protein n=1 Tax=Brooklawnia cerclae TaxID=349934 RepID=A0ABX0SCK7_9ACTN|nr:ABC transporter permease [Brooklawnia cerclae]NIH55664.1 peptide/nickel transport system permease protein [Brooklawnia cerclae]
MSATSIVVGGRSGRTGRRGRASAIGWLVVRRLGWLIPLLAALSLLVFALAELSPVDATAAFLGSRDEFVSAGGRANVEQAVTQLPWWQAWLQWIGGILTGDPGYSMSARMPVADVVSARLPWTVLLMITGLALGFAISIPLAMMAARRPHGLVSQVLDRVMWVIAAVPPFLVGLTLVAVFALGLRLLPSGGTSTPGMPATATELVRHMVLPAGAVAVGQLPWITLHLRKALIETSGDPGVRAARLRGVPEWRVLGRHILPGAMIPVLAITGARLTEVIAGSVLVEQIFSWPGLGQSLVNAALAQDFPLLGVVSMLLAAIALVGGIMSDVALALLDPRTDPREL